MSSYSCAVFEHFEDLRLSGFSGFPLHKSFITLSTGYEENVNSRQNVQIPLRGKSP